MTLPQLVQDAITFTGATGGIGTTVALVIRYTAPSITKVLDARARAHQARAEAELAAEARKRAEQEHDHQVYADLRRDVDRALGERDACRTEIGKLRTEFEAKDDACRERLEALREEFEEFRREATG